jgi:ankyrin repeat protein
VRRLLAEGAKLEDATPDGQTALMLASARGFADTALALIAQGANLEARTVHGSAVGLMGQPIKSVPAAPKGPPAEAVNAKGQTALIVAAAHGSLPVVKALLGKGARVDAADDLGQTSLHYAAAAGRAELVEALLAAGAKPDAKEAHGWTPLMLAAARGRLDAAKALLAHGAAVDAANERGQTALMIAAAQGQAGSAACCSTAAPGWRRATPTASPR